MAESKSLGDKFTKLPPLHKLMVIAGIALVITIVAIAIDFVYQNNQISKLAKTEATLRQELSTLYIKNKKLKFEALSTVALQKTLVTMLDRFAAKSKMDELLKSITKLASQKGLNIVLFKPQEEKDHGFYAELPIEMEVYGTFHQLAEFTSGIGNLDKLVTMQKYVITPVKDKGGLLEMKLTLSIYRPLSAIVQLESNKKGKK